MAPMARPGNMARVTSPCFWETALAERVRFIAAAERAAPPRHQVVEEQVMGKLIVAGRDGRMGCEDGAPAGLGTGVVERAACRASLMDQLQQRERGMPLIEMDRVE